DREIDESTIKILCNISDISTRWNSSYSSWKRLLQLKDAITWLASVLPLKKGKENQKDGQKLSQLLLKDYEWDLLKRVVNILKPFEFATTLFSGSKYPTLSIMYPIIRELQNKFMDVSLELSADNEDNDDDN
ncbi:10164_t:CDS:1, partial [Racocetra persica]